jgi:aryl carrier-like protein
VLLRRDGEHTIVLPIDWKKAFVGTASANVPSLLRGIEEQTRGGAAGAKPSSGPIIRERLAAASATERPAVIEAFLREQIARSLGLANPEALERKAPLSSSGLDSLMALELRNRIAAVTGISVSVTRLLSNCTLETLAAELAAATQADTSASRQAQISTGTSAADPEEAVQLLQQLPDLGDAEVDDLLAKLLAGDSRSLSG